MGDAVARRAVERLVQRDGIGRGQRAVGGAVGGDDAERAEARGLAAERGEDLAREVRDRGLAAGAGDRDDGLGLARIEARRRERQRAAHVGDAQIGDGGVERRPARSASPTTATAPAASACGTKAAPSALVPGTATNTMPGRDLAAVDGEARNGQRGAGGALRLGERVRRG